MHKISALIILLLLPMSIFGKSVISPQNEALLKQLDKIIEQKDSFRAARIAKADSLKLIAYNNTGERRTEALKSLYSIYERFKNDSALSIMNFATKIPEFENDPAFRDFVHVSLARTFAVMGLFTDAFNQLDKVEPNTTTQDNRLRYYNVQHAANGWLADFAMYSAPELAQSCLEKNISFNDSIIIYETDPIYREINKATKAYKEGNIEQCIHIANPLLEKGESVQQIYVYAILTQAYEKYGDIEKELFYLTKTAIGDITNGITEYMALHLLAQKLIQLGETDRAYNYIICALEDAIYCDAKLRTLEASEYFPIIDKGHKEDSELRKTLSTIVYFSLCLIVLVLVVGIISLRKQMLKLRLFRQALAKANRKLEESNNKLQIINKDLVTSDHIKEEYITRYLNKCRNYLESLEIYRNQLIKLAQVHQWDDLFKKLKSGDTLSDEKDRFYADFDELFLNLYPDFIEKFNALLRSDAQIVPKSGELLTTELRIFALIKLGITDSAQIAKFLSYSLATIYNYRSRTRNNALDSKDDFETKVLNL